MNLKLERYIDKYKELGNSESQELELLVKKYPWFHGAHVLLAKSHKNQNRYSFKNLLKKASLYSGDRTVLYDVMHDSWKIRIDDSSVEDKVVVPAILKDTVSELKESERVGETIEVAGNAPVVEENVESINVVEPEAEKSLVESKSSDSLVDDVQTDEVQRTVSEEDDKGRIVDFEESGSVETDNSKTVRSISDDANDIKVEVDDRKDYSDEDLQEMSEKKSDDVRSELEKAIKYDPIKDLQEYLDDEDLQEFEEQVKITPDIPVYDPEKELQRFIDSSNDDYDVEIPEDEIVAEEVHDMTYWLEHFDEKEKSVPKKTKKKSPKKPVSNKHPDKATELLEKFIETKPRIAKMDREFFNAEKQGKRSIEDNSDIVTETLAQLYYNQGFPEKSLEIYEKLRLQNPQKEAYFARLILEIKKKNTTQS